jgi:hypothetical protein
MSLRMQNWSFQAHCNWNNILQNNFSSLISCLGTGTITPKKSENSISFFNCTSDVSWTKNYYLPVLKLFNNWYIEWVIISTYCCIISSNKLHIIVLFWMEKVGDRVHWMTPFWGMPHLNKVTWKQYFTKLRMWLAAMIRQTDFCWLSKYSIGNEKMSNQCQKVGPVPVNHNVILMSCNLAEIARNIVT